MEDPVKLHTGLPITTHPSVVPGCTGYFLVIMRAAFWQEIDSVQDNNRQVVPPTLHCDYLTMN